MKTEKSYGEFVISTEHEIIVERFYGDMTFDLVIAATESIWSRPEYRRTFKGLADLRGCTFTMSIRDIVKLVLFLAKSDKTATGFFVILANSTDGVAKSLIFNSRMSAIMNMHVVSHLDSALRHLALTQDVYDEITSGEQIKVLL